MHSSNCVRQILSLFIVNMHVLSPCNEHHPCVYSILCSGAQKELNANRKSVLGKQSTTSSISSISTSVTSSSARNSSPNTQPNKQQSQSTHHHTADAAGADEIELQSKSVNPLHPSAAAAGGNGVQV